MNKFSIDESPDIVVNLTFNTTVLTDGSGAEERNSNWQSPLLNFDLQKVILHKPQLDEIIQFFREARGAAISFKYRDWSDYLVTAQPRTTRYGSTTQGLLLPNADGVRNEFELVKRYIVPSCTHLRAIAFADPATVTLYDANFNPFLDTDWIFADGKFVFTTPPPAGQLFCEGEFDVPVVFASDENQYRIKSTKAGNTYSIEGLQLNEVRGRGLESAASEAVGTLQRSSGVRGSSFLTSDLTPLTSLKDDLGEIDAVFALSGHFNSLVGLREQTEIITLASGFDKRTSRFSKPKGTYFLGKIPLHDDELDYLIAFFRCTKGKGLSWAFEDVSYQQKLVAVRFDEDNLSLRLNRQGRYETDGLKAIEVFEPLPVSLIDPFPVSTQEYLKFFTPSGNPTNPGNPSSPVSGYPAPPFYLLDLPYLSVFINSDNPKKLVSTYNGVQRIIGDIAYFDSLGAVNLNYKGNGKFYGTALSTDKTKFITFTDSDIGTVKNIQPSPRSAVVNIKHSGNVTWDSISYLGYAPPLAPQQPFPSVLLSVSNSFSNESILYRINVADPNYPRFTYSPNQFSYTDNRNTINTTPGGFSKAIISWDFVVGGGSVKGLKNYSSSYLPSNYSYNDSGTLTATSVEKAEHIWDGAEIIPTVASDNNSRNSKATWKGNWVKKKEINSDFSVTINSRTYYLYPTVISGFSTATISGEWSNIETEEFEFFTEFINPVVVCNHLTLYKREFKKRTKNQVLERLASDVNKQSNNNLFFDGGGFYTKYTSTNNLSSLDEDDSIQSVFNVGDLGIYIETKYKRETIRDYNSETFNAAYFPGLSEAAGAPQPPRINLPTGYVDMTAYYYVNLSDYPSSSVYSSFVEDITIEQPFNTSFYKIAYLDHIREAKAGYAGNCSFANSQTIHDFYLNSNSPSNLTISLSTDYKQTLNYLKKLTTTTTNSGGVNETNTSNTVYDYEDLDSNDYRNYDLTGRSIIVKQTYAGNIYLALCRVTSLVSTTTKNAPVYQQDLADIRTVTQLNCEIISVQKIKSFFTTSNFLFTVNGCEVFKFLDPYRTNLIKDQGKVYLAATMPPVSQHDTQTLVFQLVSDGLEFYGVFGGQVDSIPVSPGADRWIKYY